MNTADIKKVDLGCGTRKADGCFGIDVTEYAGVDLALDLRWNPLPFTDCQLDYIYTSHFLEHLTFDENLHLFNEMWRCLKPGGKLEIIVPHAMSYAQVTDLSHRSAWTEDTFGYFTPDNKYYYSWFYEKNGQRLPVINKWRVLLNDNTPPIQYTKEGWVTVKLREVHAILERLA